MVNYSNIFTDKIKGNGIVFSEKNKDDTIFANCCTGSSMDRAPGYGPGG